MKNAIFLALCLFLIPAQAEAISCETRLGKCLLEAQANQSQGSASCGRDASCMDIVNTLFTKEQQECMKEYYACLRDKRGLTIIDIIEAIIDALERNEPEPMPYPY